MSAELYTIGYAGMTAEQFVEKLDDSKVEVLIDVRQLPLSRKKGFSKSVLSTRLEGAGIEYRHVRSLGVERDLRDQLKAGLDLQEYLAAFQERLHRNVAAIEEVKSLIVERRCCLMCVEADVDACHRSVVANTLKARQKGIRLRHL